jgi:uncharacterized membrane protein YdjX (TVP38/TMEM64 family)
MHAATRISFVILLAILIPIIPFVIIGELPGERWLSSTDDNALLFGITGMGLLTADVLLPIPSSIVGTMLGARLGFIPGWAWCWLGLMLGNSIGYLTGRLLLSRFAPDIPRTPTLLLLFATRPVPVLAEAMTFTAGAEKMNFVSFLLVSLAGNGLYSVALAGNGAALLPDALVGPGLILPMLLPVAAWLLWRWLERKHDTQTTDT